MNEELKKLLSFIDDRVNPPHENETSEKSDLLTETLRERFHLRELKTHQGPVIEAILQCRNVLAILPTGYGKSLCYQLPTFMSNGLTVVVSPLISLMKDQVEQLRAICKTEATFINSMLTLAEQRHEMERATRGDVKILYVAPERFRSQLFTEKLSRCSVRLFVIDEAHCISQWGHDFRPDYLSLRDTLHFLQPASVAMFTATVTSEVEADILKQLGLTDVKKFVASPVRPNLRFGVVSVNSEEEKFKALASLTKELTEKGIIYVAKRRDAEEVAKFLKYLGLRADFYHAGLTKSERDRVQESFFKDGAKGTEIIAATNAFGLGINKENIRFVIHFAIPGSLEAYYQEAGRAGRDGQPADCILIFWEEDIGLQEWFIKQNLISKKQLLWLYRLIESQPGYKEFRWIQGKEIEWKAGFDNTKIRVGLSHLQRVGFIKQHPKIPSSLVLTFFSKHRDGSSEIRGLPNLMTYLETIKYCTDNDVSPLTMMARLFDAKWKGELSFEGTEDCILVECIKAPEELEKLTEEQLGMKAFVRQKQRQLDKIIFYSVNKDCRERSIRRYFGEKVEQNYRCERCDSCNPELHSEWFRALSTQKPVDSYLKKRELPSFKGKFIDGGISLSYHTVISGRKHVRTEVGEKVYKFKYLQEKYQVDWLVRASAELLQNANYLDKVDLVVYVPGTETNRAYEPVSLFAEKLCMLINKTLTPALRKVRNTRPQKEMQTASQKMRNVRGAFALISNEKIGGRRILLVDDLYDSGATINACAKLLKDAGASRILAFTMTKTSHVAR